MTTQISVANDGTKSYKVVKMALPGAGSKESKPRSVDSLKYAFFKGMSLGEMVPFDTKAEAMLAQRMGLQAPYEVHTMVREIDSGEYKGKFGVWFKETKAERIARKAAETATA